jgi:predicted metal-dependent HD superfamily phosphohydrolase
MIYRKASAAEIERLRAIWNEAAAHTGAGADAALSGEMFDALIRRYQEPHRAYHNAGHLAELFEYWQECRPQFAAPHTVALALFFHDAVYEIGPRASSNEAQSAALAEAELTRLGLPQQARARIAALIRMTETHDCPADDADAALMLDMDMAVLGAPPEDYDRYAAAVALEYAALYKPEEYARGRVALFLEPALRRERLFLTPGFESAYGAAAKANLAREMQALRARPAR